MYTTKAQICIRRDTAANFNSANPTLALGEIAYETDTRNLKVGDGATIWQFLPYINPYRGGTAAAPTNNTVLGNDAGVALQSGGTFNTLVGGLAGSAVTTGDFNVLVGYNAGSTITGTGTNVAVGANAMQSAKGSDNVAVGHAALNASSNGTGNIAIGRDALVLNTATNNVAIGFQALDANTTGVRNTAVGKDALGANTNSDNTAVGFEALSLVQSGEYNAAFGATAGKNLTGSQNTALGGGALFSQTSGNYNTAVGSFALWSNVSGTSNATAVGDTALGYATSASNTVAIGMHAGRLIATGANCTAATSSILIGHDARPLGNSQTNQIVIGNNSAVGNGSNTTTIGNSSTTDTFLLGKTTSTQTSATTNAVIPALQVNSQSSGTPATGIGTAIEFAAETAAGNTEIGAVIEAVTTDVTATSEDFDIVLKTMKNGATATESLRVGTHSRFLIAGAQNQNVEVTNGTKTVRTTLSNGFTGIPSVGTLTTHTWDLESGGTPCIRLDATNQNVNILTGNLIVGTSGKGIDFSATAHAGGMTSELLSDYEEGTWTPTYVMSGINFAALTMDVVSATYTKIGRQVTVRGWIRTDNVDITGATGVLSIGGLPFTTATGDAGRTSGYVGAATGWAANGFPFSVISNQGGTTMNVFKRAAADGVVANVTTADLTTGAVADQNRLEFACTYFT